MIERNSARVIGFSGRNVPSSYPDITPLDTNNSISSLAKVVVISVNQVGAEGRGTGLITGDVTWEGVGARILPFLPPPLPPEEVLIV